MTAQNAGIIRRAYDAFARAELPAVFEILDQDITWHVPGSSPLSGDYKGHGEAGGFFPRTMELSGGTFAIDIQDVLASGDRVVVLCAVSAERNGQSASSRGPSRPRTPSGARNPPSRRGARARSFGAADPGGRPPDPRFR